MQKFSNSLLLSQIALLVFLVELSSCILISSSGAASCSQSNLKHLSGNALTDSPTCLGPAGSAYPVEEVTRWARKFRGREGRSFGSGVQDWMKTRDELLSAHLAAKHGVFPSLDRSRRAANGSTNAGAKPAEHGCVVGGAPPRLCRSSYNTTAPMYGVSLTSGQPVTIVQKFPDLLQQVIYETCDSAECDVLHGECIQTYVPYLFLVIPLGPVTLTGQDYVLVESGCTCRPKYATPGSDPNPSDVIPNFN